MSVYIRKDDRPFRESVAADPCPLLAWFEKTGEKKVDFLRRSELSTRTLYELLEGVLKDHKYSTLRKVELGTGGEVTVRMLGDWLERIHPKEK